MVLYLPLQYPSSPSGEFVKPLPSGKTSKAISHYNMLLVLSCGDPPETGTRAQFGSLAHTLRNTVLIFTRPCSQKQPNQPVVRNTPTDPSQQCGDELMWVNLDFVVVLVVYQQVSKSSIQVIAVVSKSSVHLLPFISSRHPICIYKVIKPVSIPSVSQQITNTSSCQFKPDLVPLLTSCL